MLAASHEPFTWGKDAQDAVYNAVSLEFIARLASETLRIDPRVRQGFWVLSAEGAFGEQFEALSECAPQQGAAWESEKEQLLQRFCHSLFQPDAGQT